MVAGDGGREAYTAIVWGVPLSRESHNTAEAEPVSNVEGNMCGPAMRGAAHPAGVEEHITCERIAYGTWEVPRLAIGSDALVRIGKARSRSR